MDLVSFLKSARDSWAWPIMAVGYEVIVRAELLYERLLDSIFSTKCYSDELSNVTAVIKTFERPKKLKRLVASIKRRFPTLTIIIIDDSRSPATLDGVQIVALPYDSGVSAGRNEGLARVKSPYILMLDDDFVFNRHTNLLEAYQTIDSHPSIDILGGQVIYLPLRIVHDYRESRLFPNDRSPLHPPGSSIGGLPVMNKVPNFYIGRVSRIRDVGWDNQLKRIDHADFFTRAIGVLTSVQDQSFKVLHYPTYFDRKYIAKKRDVVLDRLRLQEKYYED